MNYYFKLSKPSDDDVIETDDYLEHAQHEGYYSQNLGKVNNTTVPASGSAMYRLGKCYVTTDSYRGQESHYMHVVLTNLNRKQGTNIPDFVIPLDKYDNASAAVNDFLNNMQNWYPSFWSPIRQDFKSTLIKEAHRLWYNNSNKPQHAGYYSPNLSHSITIDSSMCAVVPVGEELAHYGVKGMKWGVRRYQNPDGSLTPEGKVHYGKGGENQRGSLVASAILFLFPVAVEAAMLGVAAAASSASEKAKKRKEDKREKEAEKELFGEDKDHGLTPEDLKKVNPKFGEKGYTNNCPKCSTVLELRKRGMNVTAKSGSGQTDTEMASWFKGAKPMKDLHVDSAEEKIKEMPAGASGFISGAWPSGLGGHVVHWTNIGNGTIRIEDGQNGKVFTWDQFKEKYPFQEDRYCVTRLDNCAINEQKMKDSGVYTEYKEEEKKK